MTVRVSPALPRRRNGGAQVLDHVGDVAGGGQVDVGELDEELLEQRGVRPPAGQRRQHGVGGQARGAGQRRRFGERAELDADEHLVDQLDELAAAAAADVRHPGGDVIQYRPGPSDGGLVAADHQAEPAGARPGCAAGQGRVDPGAALFCHLGGELAGAVGGDRGHVDDEPGPPPRRPACEHAAGAEHHLFHDRRGVQRQHDNLGVGRDGGGGVLELGTTGDQVVGGCAVQVRDIQVAESVEQAGGYGVAHHAEPDHPDRAGGWDVDGVGGFGAGQGDSPGWSVVSRFKEWIRRSPVRRVLSPATPATPLTVPIKPPKAIAERGLSRPMNPRAACQP